MHCAIAKFDLKGAIDMSLQILEYSIGSKYKTDEKAGIDCRSFNNAAAFGAYETTVIDLQDTFIWRCKKNTLQSINGVNDFASLSHLINDRGSCKLVVLLPQNIGFESNYGSLRDYREGYKTRTPLKDMLHDLTSCLLPMLLTYPIRLKFGSTSTIVSGREYSADFSFDLRGPLFPYAPVHESTAQTVTTALIEDGFWVTALQVADFDELSHLLKDITSSKDEAYDYPDWLDDVEYSDEATLKEGRAELASKIACLESQVNDADETIHQYKCDKSILCTKGDPLVKNVRMMLSKVFQVADQFEDVKEEDFQVPLSDVIFAIEIKGSSGALQRKHVSRTFDHAQILQDDLEEAGDPRAAKGVLVFAEEINTPPDQRNSYPEKQVEIASKTGVAILPTTALLSIYDAKTHDGLNVDTLIRLLKDESGLIDEGKLVESGVFDGRKN